MVYCGRCRGCHCFQVLISSLCRVQWYWKVTLPVIIVLILCFPLSLPFLIRKHLFLVYFPLLLFTSATAKLTHHKKQEGRRARFYKVHFSWFANVLRDDRIEHLLETQNKEIMLAADKLQLQSSLKQQATALKEKEFNLHHNNFSEWLLLSKARMLCVLTSQTCEYVLCCSDGGDSGGSIGRFGCYHVYRVSTSS